MVRKSLKLSCTLAVKNPDGGICEGHIGLFAYDDDIGDIIGVTVAQVAGRVGDIIFESTVIARPSDNRFPPLDRSNPRPADTMLTPVFIGDVEIEEYRPAISEGEDRAPRILRDLPEVLGEPVLVHTAARNVRKAYVRSTEGQFRMPCPWTAEMTLFNCAIELATLDNNPVTKEGDAGALVTTMSGGLIGLIVCGFDDVSFAAPFATRLSFKSCELPTPARIEEFNKKVRESQEQVNPAIIIELPTVDPDKVAELTSFKEVVELCDVRVTPSLEQCKTVQEIFLGPPSQPFEPEAYS